MAIPWIAIPCGPPSSWCLNPLSLQQQKPDRDTETGSQVSHRWEKDPCCNWVKRQEQCCGPRSVEAGLFGTVVDWKITIFFHRLINTLVNHMVNIILLVVVNLAMAMENHYAS